MGSVIAMKRQVAGTAWAAMGTWLRQRTLRHALNLRWEMGFDGKVVDSAKEKKMKMILQLHYHGRYRNMNVEKQTTTLSTTGEHHAEQLRVLARKTNFWSNTSHSHDTILLLKPLVYGGEISFISDSTQGWIEKSDPLHWGEFNSLPTRVWTPSNKGIKGISREVLKPRPRLNSKLRNSWRRKKIGKSTWPKDDQVTPWTIKEQTHFVAMDFLPFSFICPSHLTAKNATVQAHQNLYAAVNPRHGVKNCPYTCCALKLPAKQHPKNKGQDQWELRQTCRNSWSN